MLSFLLWAKAVPAALLPAFHVRPPVQSLEGVIALCLLLNSASGQRVFGRAARFPALAPRVELRSSARCAVAQTVLFLSSTFSKPSRPLTLRRKSSSAPGGWLTASSRTHPPSPIHAVECHAGGMEPAIQRHSRAGRSRAP